MSNGNNSTDGKYNVKFIEGHVHLDHLQTHNFYSGQVNSYCTCVKMIFLLRIKLWNYKICYCKRKRTNGKRLLPFFCCKRKTETANFSPVCLLQTETENGSFVFSGQQTINGNRRQTAVSANVPIYAFYIRVGCWRYIEIKMRTSALYCVPTQPASRVGFGSNMHFLFMDFTTLFKRLKFSFLNQVA